MVKPRRGVRNSTRISYAPPGLDSLLARVPMTCVMGYNLAPLRGFSVTLYRGHGRLHRGLCQPFVPSIAYFSSGGSGFVVSSTTFHLPCLLRFQTRT